MQRTLALLLVSIIACSDDGANRLPPDTVLDDKPPALTNQTHAVFTFHADGVATSFVCEVDGNQTECIPPFEIDLVEGMHHFSVAAIQKLKPDDTPATYDWVIDTTPPDTAITSGPPAIDNATTATFTFTSPDPNATFECSLDGIAFAPCMSPSPVTPGDGDHAFSVRAKDQAGNVDPSPAQQAWTLDSTAPETTIVSGPTDGSTTAASVSFAFTSSDAAASFECAVDNGAFAACTSPLSRTLANGGHVFMVRAKDVHGLVDPSPAMRAWTVDTIAPPVTIDLGPASPTNDNTPSFMFSSTDPTATFECQIDGVVAFTACTATFDGPPVSDGSHTFRVRATDPVGNQSTATFTWLTDTVAPTATITSGPAGPTNDVTPTFTFTTAGAPTATQCRIDGNAFVACTSSFTSAALLDGAHTFEVRVTDAAGNSGNATRSFTVDTVPPTVAITSGPNDPTNSTSATFTFTASDGTLTCQLDTGAFATCASPKTFTGLAPGAHTFTVHATDTAGNVGSAASTWTIDLTPPVVAFTSTPVNPSNSSSASFAFTVSEGSPQCRLDTGAFAACTSPVTLTGLADGSHTFTVQSTDTAGNTGSASFTWTIDTTPPVLVIDDAPPAQWPVNYYDIAFHSPETGVTFTCSLDGAAFTACASPITVTTSYGALSTFTIRAADALGNPSTASASWTSTAGLVLHYPWEQGLTHDTSLLKQRPPYASDGPAAPLPVVGGWAGTAAGSPPAHIYPKTARALSSSIGGNYTASIWVRANAGSNGGTIWTNATAQNGIRLTLGGTLLTMTVFDGGNAFTVTDDAFPLDQWVNVAVRATGPGKGVQLWINGTLLGTAAAPKNTGFDAGQAGNVTVGALSGVDVDDLRFYNVAFTIQQMCTVVARGLIPPTGGGCVANRPGYELDFEGRIANTGFWGMRVTPPQASQFVALKLGQALQLTATAGGFTLAGFANNAPSVAEHSFTLWFIAGDASDTLVDFTRLCGAAGGPTCGAFVKYVPGQLQLFFGTAGVQKTQTINVANGPHSVVVTEQKGADGTTTQQMSIFVDGIATKVPMGNGNLYATVSDIILLSHTGGTIVDELEFFPRDLTADPEMLCENGFDGEFDVVTGACLMTSN